jgi:hypothetical protein
MDLDGFQQNQPSCRISILACMPPEQFGCIIIDDPGKIDGLLGISILWNEDPPATGSTP